MYSPDRNYRPVAGDRCISFSYDPDFFERLVHDARGAFTRFKAASLPPIRALAPVVAKALSLLASAGPARCEELAVEVAARTVQAEGGVVCDRGGDPASSARVSRVIRTIENEPDFPADLASLARIARLSPYHFLRTFRNLTGMTPHRYLLRLKLCRAAVRLASGKSKVADIALDCEFGDISNFNRAFRAEFGISPRAYRQTA